MLISSIQRHFISENNTKYIGSSRYGSLVVFDEEGNRVDLVKAGSQPTISSQILVDIDQLEVFRLLTGGVVSRTIVNGDNLQVQRDEEFKLNTGGGQSLSEESIYWFSMEMGEQRAMLATGLGTSKVKLWDMKNFSVFPVVLSGKAFFGQASRLM